MSTVSTRWGLLLFVTLCLAGMSAVTMTSAPAQTPRPPADAGQYPEPIDVPRYFPEAVVKEHAMVASAHPLASRIGVQILRDGGNAIDAMIAVQMALNVVEPQSSGIGGGCFIVYYDAKSGKTHCLDGREEVPAETTRADFLDEKGKLLAEPMTGGLPVGVPGTVAAMWKAKEQWGNRKMPMAKILEPAIQLAEDGIGVTPRLQVSIALHQPRFMRFPSSKMLFLPEDAPPELGEVRKNPDLASTFRLLAKEGPKVFYEGEIAHDIVDAVRHAAFQPGKMKLDDLKAYRAIEREPVRFHYRGHEIVSAPPPGSGGITVGLILGVLENEDMKKIKPGSIEEIELLARAGAVAFADRNAYLGDPEWRPDLDMPALLDAERLKGRCEAARALKPGTAASRGPKPTKNRDKTPDEESSSRTEGDHTTHFSIVDRDGNVVSCTTTIEHGMGSGLVVSGRGFLLNNELTDFDLESEKGANALDATRKDGRGKRPRSSMAPVIVFHDGKPWLTTGSPGGSRIIGIVAQILVNVIDHEMDMQQAINAPRVNAQNGALSLEVLYPKRVELEELLQARKWKVQAQKPWYEAWGGAQGIRIRPDKKLEGGADPRREGAVRGY